MKILFVCSGLNARYGGPAESESALLNGLANQCKLTILCRRNLLDPRFAKQKGLERVRAFTVLDMLLAFFSLGAIPSLFRDVSVVHLNGHWRWEYFIFARFARRSNACLYLHPRGMMWVGHRKVGLKKLFNKLIGQKLVDSAEKILVLSEFEKRHLTAYVGAVAKAEVVPNPVSVPEIPRKSAQQHKFVYFGRLEARKNLVFLVRAYDLYQRNGGTLGLDLIGPIERSYDAVLKREIKKLRLQGVRIVAPIFGQEKWDALRNAKGVIYPAIEEPFGRVPFEAASVGSCPIVPDESGCAEYLRPYTSFAIYDHKRPDDLARVMEYLDKNGADVAALDALSQWIRNHLNVRAVSQRVWEIYRGASLSMLRSQQAG